jgi:photosystem II stability/assembly factor-like uncharacterized protein/tetratricopeptide (TPR) repeat protein
MRPVCRALVLSAAVLVAPALRAGELRTWEDAPLHAVQFIDRDEGWAVGDGGAVWHTIDGGHAWERQPTGTTASLRSLQFLNPYTGWVVGREELPHGAGSAGVILFTRDGGLRWQRLSSGALPGLNCVRFLDGKAGFVAGDGSDQYPSGVFQTADCGKTWQPVPGPRCTTWLAADFQGAKDGALAGAWNRLAFLRGGTVVKADADTLGGRSVRSLHLAGKRGVAVGEGGLVLLSEDTAKPSWEVATDLGQPLKLQYSWDFHAVYEVADHIWAVGRPGSAVLHSGNAGKTWQVQHTGQPLPLHGIFFLDAQRGWAVGDCGTILGTQDGGRTWQVQHRGGERAALLLVHARAAGLPVEAVAALGGEEGYLATAVRVQGADPASAAPGRSTEPQRLEAAVRQAGGAAGEVLWQFPLPQHLGRAGKPDVMASWDALHNKRAADHLLRQLVLALRIWRPEVVVTDCPKSDAGGYAVDALVAEAVKEAFVRAADPGVYPEHLETLGLQPWQASKLYACWPGQTGAHASMDLTGPGPRLQCAPRDFAAGAAALLADGATELPRQRFFRLLASKSADAVHNPDLMAGTILPPGGVARRSQGELKELPAEVVKAAEARRNLEALIDAPPSALTDPNMLLAEIAPTLDHMPPDQAAQAAYAAGMGYVRQGQWTLAREAFLLMVDRYPADPLAAEAYRWLIRYNSSSEARRRQELGQFLTLTRSEFQASEIPGSADPKPGDKGGPRPPRYDVHVQQTRHLTMLSGRDEARRWYQGSLEIEPRLAAFGPVFAADPSVQFCLQSARRSLGDFEAAKKWYARFVAEHPAGPWRELAATELWLANRSGPPPRPVAFCRQTDTRPFLDGRLDDDCWTAHKPVVLHNAVGETAKDYPTEVWLAYDKEFLYVAARCRHPAGHHVDPVKPRPRDADVRPFDRISLMLDLDRDYSTYFHLQIDQRGCVCEDCWGDLTWNPRWFVAVKSDAESWQVEAAIPMIELTGDVVTVGHAWGCNLVRVLPGRGVQAMSVPADVQPRPEGMGLLIFTQDAAPPATERPAVPMTKAASE